MHARLSQVKLASTVPDNVRRQFETARNLMLYAWFVFEFQTVSEMQAYASLELALRTRFPEAKRERKRKQKTTLEYLTLRPLLELAVKNGLIIPEKLPAWERNRLRREWHEKHFGIPTGKPLSASEWLQALVEIIPNWRNSLAHGDSHLFLEASLNQLELCADLINALFQTAG